MVGAKYTVSSDGVTVTYQRPYRLGSWRICVANQRHGHHSERLSHKQFERREVAYLIAEECSYNWTLVKELINQLLGVYPHAFALDFVERGRLERELLRVDHEHRIARMRRFGTYY